MSKTRLSMLGAWAGLLTAPLAWYGYQQGLGSLVYFSCGASHPPTGPLAGFIAILVTAAASACSWRAWKASAAAPAIDIHRFAALLSVLAAAIFCVAIGFQTLATTLIPSCAR